MKQQVVFLIVTGRAGSYLLHSLLDSHPQILSFPCILGSYFFQNVKYYENIDHFLNYFVNSSMAAHTLNGVENLALGRNSTRLYKSLVQDKKRFLSILTDELKKLSLLSRRETLIAVHKAYGKWRGQDVENCKIILEHLHLPGCLDEALKDFPEAKVIQLVREPVSAMYSHNKYEKQCYGFVPSRQAYTFYKACFLAGWEIISNAKLFSSQQYKLIRLEDLHNSQSEYMKNLSRWLDINYHDCLSKSTINGIPWNGNSGRIKKLTGFSRKLLSPNNEVNFTDRLRVGRLLNNTQASLAYPRIDFQSTFMRRFFSWVSLLLPLPHEFSINVVAIYKRSRLLNQQYHLVSIFFNKVAVVFHNTRFIKKTNLDEDSLAYLCLEEILILGLTVKQFIFDQLYFYMLRVYQFIKSALKNNSKAAATNKNTKNDEQ